MKIKINPDICQCKEVKLCASLCPYGFIWETPKTEPPFLKPDLEHYCIDCGHCESICPNGAVRVQALEESAEKFDQRQLVGSEQADLFLKTRRSVRTFKQDAVPQKILEDLMDITRWIPTASNKQQVKWMLYNSKDTIQQLAQLTVDFIRSAGIFDKIIESWEQGEDLVLRHAPHLIIALGEKDYFWSDAEAGIALAYLELAAHARSLGTCWAGFLTRAANQYSPLQDYLELPEGQRVCGAVMLGYPAFKLRAIPFRKMPDITWK